MTPYFVTVQDCLHVFDMLSGFQSSDMLEEK